MVSFLLFKMVVPKEVLYPELNHVSLRHTCHRSCGTSSHPLPPRHSLLRATPSCTTPSSAPLPRSLLRATPYCEPFHARHTLLRTTPYCEPLPCTPHPLARHTLLRATPSSAPLPQERHSIALHSLERATPRVHHTLERATQACHSI
eukprot:Phypoly_transcript_06167.p1 GENE.Phypoly_transcript_06167~~Phypoly_transcript_06167.p1  ORF type:complete len:147 (-),score=36.25 Phypoly_transcript_06167:802-1242(-)